MLLHRAKLLSPHVSPYRNLPGRDGEIMGPVSIEPLVDFTGYEALISSRNNDGRDNVSRTVEFLNWRFAKCPLASYVKLLLTHGGEEALAVMRLSEVGGWNRGQLVDLIYDGATGVGAMPAFMQAVELYAAKSGVEIFEYETSDINVLNAFSSCTTSVKTQTRRLLYGNVAVTS
jgi:hypothetical protein